MLSEELKNRKVLSDEYEKQRREKEKALRAINSAVRDLIGTMKAIELDGTLSREKMEAFVIKRMGHYETVLYPKTHEEFGEWMADQLVKASIGRRFK